MKTKSSLTLSQNLAQTLSEQYEVIEREVISDCNYDGITLSGSLIKGSQFRNVTFRGCVIFSSKWEECEFIGCTFENCIFQFSAIKSCQFKNVKFLDCTWQTTQVESCAFFVCHLDHKTLFNAAKGEDNTYDSSFAPLPPGFEGFESVAMVAQTTKI